MRNAVRNWTKTAKQWQNNVHDPNDGEGLVVPWELRLPDVVHQIAEHLEGGVSGSGWSVSECAS